MSKNNPSLKSRNIMDNIVQYFSFSVIIILVVGLYIYNPNFLGKMNLKNMFRDPAPLMLMAAGMTMILILGSIDLSMGAMCSVSNVVYVHFLLNYGDSFASPELAGIVALLLSVLIGALSGLALGIIHVKLKVPSFIASLGFMSVWQSAALLVTQNPESLPKKMWPAINWYRNTVFGVVGVPLLVALAVVIIIWMFTRFTPFGRAIFAIGGNERASRVAGISVDSTKILIFSIGGALAALGGVFLAANMKSSAPTVGNPYTLQIVASCALGGTSLAGGKGSVLGTILGVFTVILINSGMTFLGIDAYWQNVVFGAFVLGAIALTVDRKTRGQIIK